MAAFLFGNSKGENLLPASKGLSPSLIYGHIPPDQDLLVRTLNVGSLLVLRM